MPFHVGSVFLQSEYEPFFLLLQLLPHSFFLFPSLSASFLSSLSSFVLAFIFSSFSCCRFCSLSSSVGWQFLKWRFFVQLENLAVSFGLRGGCHSGVALVAVREAEATSGTPVGMVSSTTSCTVWPLPKKLTMRLNTPRLWNYRTRRCKLDPDSGQQR